MTLILYLLLHVPVFMLYEAVIEAATQKYLLEHAVGVKSLESILTAGYKHYR